MKNFKDTDGTIFCNGYGMIAKYVMKDSQLDIKAKAIYSYLSTYAGAGDYAFPSLPTMAQDLDLNIKTIRKYIDILEARGYLIRVQEKKKSDGKYGKLKYFFNYELSRLNDLEEKEDGRKGNAVNFAKVIY